MSEIDRELAESLLNRLMQGSMVTGMRFYTPQLLLEGPKDIRQEAYVNLTSEWGVYDSLPNPLPYEFEEQSQEEEEAKILSLRGEEVSRVEVLFPWPHLVVHFKSGKVLFMNGEDHQYEPWTAGLSNFGVGAEHWLVVACPGGGIAVWTPDNWERSKNV